MNYLLRNALLMNTTSPVDITIVDGVITAIDPAGKGAAPAEATVTDLEGRLVTPGFIDVHTHLDAQLAWDPVGTSTSWHGVTSVVLGTAVGAPSALVPHAAKAARGA